MSEYSEMSQEEQIALLQEFATDVLVQYGIEIQSIECVNHAYNSTFRFTSTENKTYALRINTNSKKWPEHIWAEVQWLNALAEEGVIHAPIPIPNLQGELFSNHYFFYEGGNLNVIVYPWIEGEVVERDPTEEQLFELGKAMAHLQKFGLTWRPTGYANFLAIDNPLVVRYPILFRYPIPEIPPELYEMLEELNLRTEKLFESLRERAETQIIHADLHFGNVIWHEGKMSILDFDDAGRGFPLQDLAIALYYLRSDKEREKALIAGFLSVAPLPAHEPWELELLIASRSLLLLDYLLETSTAEDAAYLPTYLANTEKRLRHYFDSGEFLLLK